MHHGADLAGTAAGFIMIPVSSSLGFITLGSIGESLLLGAAGALGGWLMTQLIKVIMRPFKKPTKNENEKDNTN